MNTKKTTSRLFVKAFVAFGICGILLIPFGLRAETIEELDSQIKTKKSEQKTLENEIALFDGQIEQLTSQIQSTQNDINKTNAEIEDLVGRIKAAEEDLKVKRETLNEYLRVIYEESNTSPLELVASSDSFSDFVDRSEYLQTMQVKIKDMVEKIKVLKLELENKKKDLEKKKSNLNTLMTDLSLQNRALNDQRNAKDGLLSQTKEQLNDLATQRAALVRYFNEILSGGSTSYPYGNPPPANQVCDTGNCTADAYGYFIGQCTSYSAWWRSAHGRPVPRNLGNANTWAVYARNQGYSVDKNPRVGDVMVMPYVGGYGHVAIVEAVNGDGTIKISEYNWGLDSRYSVRDSVNPMNYNADFIH